MTDTVAYYRKPLLGFAGHETVNHEQDEYARGKPTPTLSKAISPCSRGVCGVFISTAAKSTFTAIWQSSTLGSL